MALFRKLLPFVSAVAAAIAGSSAAVPAQDLDPSWESRNARATPGWFADAKFGIFIHWGVYSVPSFCDTSTYSEWYQHWLDTNAHDGLERRFHAANYGEDFEYREFAPLFRAELFDPAEWADIFRRAGARYVVLTSKHHDGYCLWPSEVASEVRGYAWNSAATGPRRDLVGELSEAVRAAGLDMGLYYSFMEWHSPLYDGDRAAYVERVMFPQIRELVERYRPTVFWPDGEWNHPDSSWRALEIVDWIRANHPDAERLVINDRWGKGLRGRVGDFYTTEYGHHGGHDTFAGRKPFEECRGTAGSFAFNRAEGYDDYISRTAAVRLLIDTVARGGNLLLDVGPTADGRIPLIQVDRLLAIGRWLETYGESIYGTTRAPFTRTPWGNATAKGGTVYLQLYDWPERGWLHVAGLQGSLKRVRWVTGKGPADDPQLEFQWNDRGLGIDLSRALQQGLFPDPHAAVVALDFREPPAVDPRRFPAADGSFVLDAGDAALGPAKDLQVESHDDRAAGGARSNLGYWTTVGDGAAWDGLVVEAGRRYQVWADVAIQPGNEGGTLQVEVGGARVQRKLGEATAGWQAYRSVALGTLTLDEVPEGGATLRVSAAAIPEGKALANLRSIRLLPEAR